MAAAVLAIGMPPSAAVAAIHQASVLARRVYVTAASSSATTAASFISGNSRPLASISNYQTAAAAAGHGIPSLDRAAAAAASGFSSFETRRHVTTAVSDGEDLNEGEMLVLGIETSCDDTGAAVVHSSAVVPLSENDA